MTDQPQEDEDREDRDRERSDEAHWRVAEEGVDDQPTKTTQKGLEIPAPERDDFHSKLEKASRPDDSAIR
jgi:hypothetical protein